MPIYNNPAIGQGFQSLAAAFAPLGGADMAGYATANAKKQQTDIISRLAADPANAGFDMQSILADLYDPTQSFQKVGMDDATNRRGQDITASTTITTNAADNDRALIQAAMEGAMAPVAQDAARPGFSPGAWGVAGPDVPGFAGPRSPLSETQVIGAEREALKDSGLLTPDMLVDTIMGKETPVQIVGENGPQYSTPGAAVRTGATPYDKPTGQPETQNYKTATGQTGSAVFDPTIKDWVDTSTGERIPAGSVTFSAGLTGSATDTGLAKTTEANDRAGYAYEMAAPATQDLLAAFDNGTLPSANDYRMMSIISSPMSTALRPELIKAVSPEGQAFYQNLRTALPLQLMTQSGQAVTEQEYDRKMMELLPIAGEDPSVTASKKRQLELYLEAVQHIAGPAMKNIGAPTIPVEGAPAAAERVYATNPTTGARLMLENGQWVAAQ